MIDGLHDGTPYFLIQSRCLKTSAINQKTTNQQCLNFEIPKIVSIFVHTPYVDSGWHPELEKSFNVHCMFFSQQKIYTKCLQAKNHSKFQRKNAAIVAFLQICHLLVALPETPSPVQHTNNRVAQPVLT